MTNTTPKKPEDLPPRKTHDSLEVVYHPGDGWVYVFENRHNQTVNGDKGGHTAIRVKNTHSG